MAQTKRKFKVSRIYIVEAYDKEDAMIVVQQTGGEFLEYVTAKPYEEPGGFVKTLVKQVQGR